MKIEFTETGAPVGGGAVLALAAFEGVGLQPAMQALDTALAAKVARLMERNRYSGRMGETLSFLTPPGLDAEAVLVIGAGKQDAWSPRGAELFAAHAYNAAKATGVDTLVIALPDSRPRWRPTRRSACAWPPTGSTSTGPRRSRRRSPRSRRSRIAADAPDAAAAAFAPLAALADAISFTRDLVSEPANVLYPAEFARRVKALETPGPGGRDPRRGRDD